MLKILHKGIQVSGQIDPALLADAGLLWADSENPDLQALKGGKLITKDSNGYVKVADGATDGQKVLGFLILDAEGRFFENRPALGSGSVAYTFGNTVVVTDQIDTDETFAPGDELYCGTGAKAGLITKTNPAPAAKLIGIADSVASAASPELTVLVF